MDNIVELHADANDTELSVVLITDRYATIRDVIASLAAQTARDKLEVVIVAPSRSELDAEEAELMAFPRVRLVETGPFESSPKGRASGIRAARSPIVYLGETHAYPHADWAERLINAHRDGWDAVVPGFRNANPVNGISWANYLLDYSFWEECLPSGEIAHCPTWNTAYKRELLTAMCENPAACLSFGDTLQTQLRKERRRFYLLSDARLDHLNASFLLPAVHLRYLGGRMVASSRGMAWPLWRRFAYACGAPLIPFVILSRMAGPIREVGRSNALPPGTYGALILGAIVSAFGEMVGYAIGAGPDSERAIAEYELNKVRYTDDSRT